MCEVFGPRYGSRVENGDVIFYDFGEVLRADFITGVPVFKDFRMPVGELLRMFADITRQHRQEQARKAFTDPAMA